MQFKQESEYVPDSFLIYVHMKLKYFHSVLDFQLIPFHPDYCLFVLCVHTVVNQRGCSSTEQTRALQCCAGFTLGVSFTPGLTGSEPCALLYLICGVDELHSFVGHGQHDGRHFLHLFCRLLVQKWEGRDKKRGKKTAVTLEAARESKLDNLTWRI